MSPPTHNKEPSAGQKRTDNIEAIVAGVRNKRLDVTSVTFTFNRHAISIYIENL